MEELENNFIEKIKKDIKLHGHHITMVTDAIEPNYAYTIGLSEESKFELIFAGGIFYMKEQIFQIINEIAEKIKNENSIGDNIITSFGEFKISKVHHTWAQLMMLGVYRFYNVEEVSVLQIIPSKENFTLDVPDMSKEWNTSLQPVWQWIVKDWNYSIPKNSKVITNLNALKGEPITEVMRWEPDEWEAFAGPGPDVEENEIRVVSVGTLLGIDKSLEAILKLDIGKGIWRDSEELVWNDWN